MCIRDRFEGFVPQPAPDGSYLFQYGTWTYENLKPVTATGPGQAGGGSSSAVIGGIAPREPTTASDTGMSLISGPDTAPRSSASGRRGVLAPGVRYGLSRLLSAAGTFIFVILFNFFLFRLLPGDPISLYTRGRDVLSLIHI